MDQPPGAPTRQHQDFSRLVNPRAVAVIGASNDLTRIGGQPLKLLTEFGYQGKVYPVNPKYTEIKNLVCYPDIASVPKPCDVALVALSSQHVISVIEQCGAAGIPFAIVLSAGFSEVGGDGVVLQEKLIATAKRCGVRVIGPNCLGMLNLKDHARRGRVSASSIAPCRRSRCARCPSDSACRGNSGRRRARRSVWRWPSVAAGAPRLRRPLH